MANEGHGLDQGHGHHWRHGWIPLDDYARAIQAGQKPTVAETAARIRAKRAGTVASAATTPRALARAHPTVTDLAHLDRLKDEIEKNGGFTYNPRTGGLLRVGEAKGFAIAVPGTETVVGEEKVNGKYISREDFAKGVAKIIRAHKAEFAQGAVLGGWYSPERNQFMVELSEIFPPGDREGAIAVGKRRNQEAIFDLSTGETIFTGGSGDAPVPKAKAPPGVDPATVFVTGPPTPEKIAAAKFYTGPGFKPLNASLRFGVPIGPQVEFYRKRLDDLLESSVVPKDTTVYRNVQGGSWLPDLTPGQTFRDKGYISTSFDSQANEDYASDTQMTIRVPKGAHALDLYAHGITHHGNERELLLPHGTPLRIFSDVRTADGRRHITAEVVS